MIVEGDEATIFSSGPPTHFETSSCIPAPISANGEAERIRRRSLASVAEVDGYAVATVEEICGVGANASIDLLELVGDEMNSALPVCELVGLLASVLIPARSVPACSTRGFAHRY